MSKGLSGQDDMRTVDIKDGGARAVAVEAPQTIVRSNDKEQLAAWRQTMPDELQGLCDSIVLNDIVKERSVEDDLLQGEDIIADYVREDITTLPRMLNPDDIPGC